MDIQLQSILFQIINFGVVAGALTYLLFKPVKKVLDERSEKIEQAQKAAELTLAEKQQIDELKKKARQDAEKQASELLETAAQAAQAKKKDALTEAREQAKAEILKMREEWEDEKKAEIEHIQKKFADAVITTAEKVIQQSLDKKAHAKLIDTELKQVLSSL